MIKVEINTPIIQERNNLLKRLDELNSLIEKNTRDIINENEVTKMADEENVVQEKVRMSIPERFEATKKLIAEGKKNKEISTELDCSVAYVYNVRMGKTVLKEKKVKEPKVKKEKKQKK